MSRCLPRTIQFDNLEMTLMIGGKPGLASKVGRAAAASSFPARAAGFVRPVFMHVGSPRSFMAPWATMQIFCHTFFLHLFFCAVIVCEQLLLSDCKFLFGQQDAEQFSCNPHIYVGFSMRKWLMDVFILDTQGTFFHQFIFHQLMNSLPQQDISMNALILCFNAFV